MSELPPVLASVPGQDDAAVFLARAAERPHHAFLFAGAEGSGKALMARAFAAALLCEQGGCGECRDCRLALGDRHPNLFVLEPEGRDIRVGEGSEDTGTARWLVGQVNLTSPEPGRKVFRVDQADRMTEEAADVLLKSIEEPPGETVFIVSSARPDELPETIRSRCQSVWFRPLAEDFVVETLAAEGVSEERARLAARMTSGNLGRARRLAIDEQGLAFRDEALAAYNAAGEAPAGALAAAERLTESAKAYRKRFADRLDEELEPYLDPDSGEIAEQFRVIARRLKERHERQERRAEREFLDSSLLALESWFRDGLVRSTGGSEDLAINLDIEAPDIDAADAARAVEVLEAARAALADETNLNVRLIVEEAFLGLQGTAPVRP
ncbi:MAG: AAA family ATPase [Actinomycetota bacterium]